MEFIYWYLWMHYLLIFNIHQEYSNKKTQIYSTTYQQNCPFFVQYQFFMTIVASAVKCRYILLMCPFSIWLLRVTFIIKLYLNPLIFFSILFKGDRFFFLSFYFFFFFFELLILLILLKNIWYSEVRINILGYNQILAERFYFCCC